MALGRNFECKLRRAWLAAKPAAFSGDQAAAKSSPSASKLRLRFSLWQNGLPVDALPLEGWIELPLLSEEDLLSLG